MPPQRTFGWVQNPSSIVSLKNTVGVFQKGSLINRELVEYRIPKLLEYSLACDEGTMNRFLGLLNQDKIIISYTDLKGRGAGEGLRGNAKCSGIIQAAVVAQKWITVKNKDGFDSRIKKPYIDDWSADGFLRWAISIGLIDYNRNDDTCAITETGSRFVHTASGSAEEKEILGEAYLSYPPAVRILSLLRGKEHLTKFELGSQLGFIGEAGFTSIPQNMFVSGYCEATLADRIRIRSDEEGSSDKYARMIAGWLSDIGWVYRHPKTVTETYAGKTYSLTIGQAYTITLEGFKNLKKAYGLSKSKRIPKIVFYEMLATKTSDKYYVRSRRANIIKYISINKRTLAEIQNFLKTKSFDESISTIKDDILGLQSIGIFIKKDRDTYKILDEIIKLEIPAIAVEKTEISVLKDAVREKLKTVNHKYLSLIDLSFDSQADREFEIQTIDLLTNELAFEGARLGNARKPDGIISHNKDGVIIENKAYSAGYILPMSQADEMVRYIGENQRRNTEENPNQWWKNFNPDVCNFHYLFISSLFVGKFIDRLVNISGRTGISGAAINSQNILYLAEKLKTGKIGYSDFFSMFENKEITIS